MTKEVRMTRLDQFCGLDQPHRPAAWDSDIVYGWFSRRILISW